MSEQPEKRKWEPQPLPDRRAIEGGAALLQEAVEHFVEAQEALVAAEDLLEGQPKLARPLDRLTQVRFAAALLSQDAADVHSTLANLIVVLPEKEK